MKKKEIIGLIPAAGKGERLGLPFPKELYPIIFNKKYKPVSEFILENIVEAGISQVIFVINETKHQLISYFRNGKNFDCDLSYVYQDVLEINTINSTSPGLVHALNSAYHLTAEKDVFFGMADTIILPSKSFSLLLDWFYKTKSNLAFGLFHTLTPHKFGMVDLGEGLNILTIIDKPQTTSLEYMWGCAVWDCSFTDHLRNSFLAGENDFANIVNSFIQSGKKCNGLVFPKGEYYDLGTYEEILEIGKKFANYK